MVQSRRVTKVGTYKVHSTPVVYVNYEIDNVIKDRHQWSTAILEKVR